MDHPARQNSYFLALGCKRKNSHIFPIDILGEKFHLSEEVRNLSLDHHISFCVRLLLAKFVTSHGFENNWICQHLKCLHTTFNFNVFEINIQNTSCRVVTQCHMSSVEGLNSTYVKTAYKITNYYKTRINNQLITIKNSKFHQIAGFFRIVRQMLRLMMQYIWLLW